MKALGLFAVLLLSVATSFAQSNSNMVKSPKATFNVSGGGVSGGGLMEGGASSGGGLVEGGSNSGGLFDNINQEGSRSHGFDLLENNTNVYEGVRGG